MPSSFDVPNTLTMIQKLKQVQPTGNSGASSPHEPDKFHQVICTDGACTNNGRGGALAGVGVYFGPSDARNISTPLPGELQTNNRAELQALIYALLYLIQHPDQRVYILSDSAYCVNGFNSWVFGWASRNWVKSDGKHIANQDMWMQVWTIKKQLHEMGITFKVSWVRGHNGHAGNEAADRLAVDGIALHPRYVAPVPTKKTTRKRKVAVVSSPSSRLTVKEKAQATNKLATEEP